MEIPNPLFDALAECSPSAAWFALCLYRHGGQSRFKCSKLDLVELSGLSKRSIDRAVEELEGHGLLTVHRSSVGGRGALNGYTVVVPAQ